MPKSARYDYATRPCFDRLSKMKRKKLHRTFRHYSKQIIKQRGDFEPMPRRCSWG